MPEEKGLRLQSGRKGCLVKEIPPSQAWEMICAEKAGLGLGKASTQSDRTISILDVRTPEEYASGHLDGAANADFRSAGFREAVSGLNREKAYLVYCRTGIRAGQAAVVMAGLGFLQIYNLSGGISRWRQEGFEVVRKSPGKNADGSGRI